MSQLYVLVAVIAMTINLAITLERVKHGLDQIEKPKMIRKNIVFSRNKDVPFTDSSSVFFLHLLKYKPQYQKLDKIFSTTAATVRDCICVPFYLCDRNQTIITDGSGIIDERLYSSATNRQCTGDLEVCCYPPTVIRSTISISSTNVTRMTPVTSPTITSPIAPSTMSSITFPNMPSTPPTTPPTTAPTTIPITFPTSASPTSPTIEPCICVMISLCDPNGIVSVSGEGVINPRYGLCPDNYVCCRILVNMTQPTTSFPTTISIIPLAALAAMTTVPPTVTMVSPGQMQLCFICDNVNLCFTCMIVVTSGGGAMIDPRVSQILSEGNICTSTIIPSCLNTSSAAPITDLGQLKNPGTSQECYCVKTWLCAEGNAISPDGLGIIDSRFTLCSSADQVCCRFTGINRQGLQGASSFNAVANGPSNHSTITCGVQNNNYAPSQPFSPDSEETYFAEFPWMVALLKSTTSGPYIFHCGASIISNRAILTAAHCVANQKPENLVARFGQWNLGNDIQPLPIQEAKIVAIAIHPSYYSDGLFHDVAVLVLAKPITYSANVLPICLPEQGKVFLAGIRCYGIGWGSNSFGPEGRYHAQLRKMNLPIVNQGDCQTRLRSTKLGQYFQLHGSFICAGGEANKDTCRGDGGGPLVCQVATGQFFQAGIVSWGIGCGASNVPAVYASVSQHRQWIDQQFATYGV